jgi:hypothetical protein
MLDLLEDDSGLRLDKGAVGFEGCAGSGGHGGSAHQAVDVGHGAGVFALKLLGLVDMRLVDAAGAVERGGGGE